MAHLQTRVLTHSQKVCSLYKRLSRNVESYCPTRYSVRLSLTVLRGEFDKNKDLKDMRVAQAVYEDGEKWLRESMHPLPKKFPNSHDGGMTHNREIIPPDWVLDYWDPIEKAAYPKYFALREKRKKEYVEMYEKKYGKSEEAV